MSSRIALCIDEETCRNPELIGLEGEPLTSQQWLSLFASGVEAREALAQGRDISEVWIVSCDDVEPINLAATIKEDQPDVRVLLVTFEACGSLLSRAHTAHIDEVLEHVAFLRRYAEVKREFMGCLPDERETPAEPVQKDEPIMQVTPAITPEVVQMQEEKKTDTPVMLVSHAKHQTEAITTRASNRAFVISVVSGSGGAGKSAVAAMTALLASKSGNRTLLIDCDLQFGDMAMMVGNAEALGIDVAIAHPDQLENMVSSREQLVVLAAPERLETAESIVPSLAMLFESLSDAFEVIVVNTGASWAEQHAVLLERSSIALFLVDQRVSSVWACKHALELCARCGIASGPFRFALNRCVKGAPLSTVDVSCALQGAPVFELKDGGPYVEECLSSGSAEELVESGNEFVKSIEQMLNRLMPGGVRTSDERPPAEPKRSVILRRGRHADKKRGRR